MRTFAVITITFLLFAVAIQAQQPPIRVLVQRYKGGCR